MRILILGASSQIGKALATVFAPGNALILVGRDGEKLQAAEAACLKSGAGAVVIAPADLAAGIGGVQSVITSDGVDLVVDASSAASRLRDSEVALDEFESLVKADAMAKIGLFEWLRNNQAAPLSVIYITTVLTQLVSPDRAVYTSLKRIVEHYLLCLKRHEPRTRLLLVHVGTLISARHETTKPGKLACAVADAFQANRESLSYGVSGRLYLIVFYLQPLVFFLLTVIQRMMRKSLRRD
jgi:short-subunit dehydrogenase